MKTVVLFTLLSSFAFAQEITNADKYLKQAEEERKENELTGIEIRKDMKKASGLNKNDPRLRKENEPINQAEIIMRP